MAADTCKAHALVRRPHNTIRQNGSLQYDRPAPYSCGACGLRACRWVWGFTLREPHTGLGYRLHYVSDGHGVCLEALPEFLWMVYICTLNKYVSGRNPPTTVSTYVLNAEQLVSYCTPLFSQYLRGRGAGH